MTELVNVVGGGDLKIGIKLEQVYRDMSAPVLRYDPESFAGLYIKFEEESPTIMLFSSGKYNIAGADSTKSLRNAHKQLLSSLTDLGIEIDENEIEIEIRNRVYVDDCGYELDLEMLLPDLGFENTEYNPESFPGIMYRPEEGGLLVIFRSGKMMITGLKDPEKVTQILERTKNRINNLF
jgi:transcription initiation factor TFIID TATA-box-binding protein